MGLKEGQNEIIQILQNGTYHRGATNVDINVDGELILHKGNISKNTYELGKSEKLMAFLAFQFLMNSISKIEKHISGSRPQVTFTYNVYMDGIRTLGKEKRANRHRYPTLNITSLRTNFKKEVQKWNESFLENKPIKWRSIGPINLIQLEKGEAELQMYLQRNRSSELTILLTNDSDMLPICYGHSPTILKKGDSPLLRLGSSPEDPLSDQNRVYPDDWQLLDSCAWVRCSSQTPRTNKKQTDIRFKVVGFDSLDEDPERNFFMNKRTFRCFSAACGTDYTCRLLTQTMITEICSVYSNNSLNPIPPSCSCVGQKCFCFSKILAWFYYCSRNSTPPRRNPNLGVVNLTGVFGQIEIAMNMYNEYLETGEMPDGHAIPQFQNKPAAVWSYFKNYFLSQNPNLKFNALNEELFLSKWISIGEPETHV